MFCEGFQTAFSNTVSCFVFKVLLNSGPLILSFFQVSLVQSCLQLVIFRLESSFVRVSSPAGWVGGCVFLRVKFGARPPPCQMHTNTRTTAATADDVRLLALLAQHDYWITLLATTRTALYAYDDLTDYAENQLTPRLCQELNMAYGPLREVVTLCTNRVQTVHREIVQLVIDQRQTWS